MNVSSLRQGSAARVCGYAAWALAIILCVGNCGSPPAAPTPATTSTATTTIASTTTVPITTTVGSTSTTTTIIGVLDARIDIQNPPCVAPGSGAVSCTFTGAATTGGRTPYTFSWKFTNPANNEVVNATGPTAQPALGCGFSTGVATFNIRAEVTVRDSDNTSNTDNRDVEITRAAGACGT